MKCHFLWSLLFSLHTVFSFAGNSKRAERMTEKIQNLGPQAHFTIIDLDLSNKIFKLFEQLRVDRFLQYNCYGQLDLLNEELADFFRQIGNEDENAIQAVVECIVNIAQDVKSASGKETAWICLGASLPNNYFTTPRWHADGLFCAPGDHYEYRFVCTLKGRHTLFYHLPDERRETFMRLNVNGAKNRLALNDLVDMDQAVSLQRGQGAFFIVGNDLYSGIHSEPHIDQQRIFMSIVPANQDEMEKLRNHLISL